MSYLERWNVNPLFMTVIDFTNLIAIGDSPSFLNWTFNFISIFIMRVVIAVLVAEPNVHFCKKYLRILII